MNATVSPLPLPHFLNRIKMPWLKCDTNKECTSWIWPVPAILNFSIKGLLMIENYAVIAQTIPCKQDTTFKVPHFVLKTSILHRNIPGFAWILDCLRLSGVRWHGHCMNMHPVYHWCWRGSRHGCIPRANSRRTGMCNPDAQSSSKDIWFPGVNWVPDQEALLKKYLLILMLCLSSWCFIRRIMRKGSLLPLHASVPCPQKPYLR